MTYLQANINSAQYFLKKGYYQFWAEGSRMEDGIWVTSGLSLSPLIEQIKWHQPVLADLRYRSCLPSIRNIVEESGFGPPDIIWTTIPGSSALKKIFPESRLIFHSIDNYEAFQGRSINRLLRVDYKRAERIFVIGEAIKADVISKHKVDSDRITNLGQGVNLSPYQKNLPMPDEYSNMKGPIAVWVGVLKKLDKDYLRTVLKAMSKSDGSVVLIGPKDPDFDVMALKWDNLYLLGSRKAEDVPAYLVHADLGLMIYNRNNQEVYKGQHPLKLYEYAAAGIPVISTWHQEFESLNPPVYLVNDDVDLELLVEQALKSSNELKRDILQFAERNSWQNCMNKALEVMHTVMNLSTNNEVNE
ncbi:hypothetical protein BST85_04495 [Aureitalea marina]|uniref:Glycosyl transferase family 1 domain-containing protein n=1 Tax=Aureitalea marina TaxID=930804 RepID=A0A2S7KNN7_9FLAO|nr:hypothetical protein BST85_04495 [Aureitalea marina]